MYMRKVPLTCGETRATVNSVQGRISDNRFKFSTRKTVCMHFCNQHKQFAEPSVMLEKNPIKVATEAKFLDVLFDQSLSYKKFYAKYF